MRPRVTRVVRWLASAALVGLGATGCPQLLDDDFTLTSGGGGADASSDGSGGQAGSDANADADPCASCTDKQTCCDGFCVETSSNPKNCGECGRGCPGTTCSSGQCTNTCALGFLDCDKNAFTGCEANSASDPENCGSCGAKCSFDQTCELGKCACPQGSDNCDGKLETGCETNLASDAANCGSCGKSCGPNQVCSAGKCACDTGFGDCNSDPNDGCEAKLAEDGKNCGSCGTSCGVNGACAGAKCGCLTGFLDCDASAGCESAIADPKSCGKCGSACSGATPNCDGTQCVAKCSANTTQCGNSCVETKTDPLHCGGCNQPVGSNQNCVAGKPTCLPGFGDCNTSANDGCEVDLTQDPQHCGSCTGNCKPGAVCSSSTCQCSASLPNDCGSECRECCSAADCTDSDPCTSSTCDVAGKCATSNCASGAVCCAQGCFECCVDGDCSGGKVCSGNQCVTPTCTAPEVLCAGKCVDPGSDPQNCGGCGVTCGAGRSCALGACTPAWAPVTASGAPSPRSHAASAALSGVGKLFVWGGLDAAGAELDSGAVYDVATDSWSALPNDTMTPTARSQASAVFCGDRVMVWGGQIGSGVLATGALYDPVQKAWGPVSTAGAPSARRAAHLVWTGSKVLVWGGTDGNQAPQAGTYLYDPSTDSWTNANPAGAPTPRNHSTVGYGGTDFLVYGGRAGNTNYAQTFRYRVSTDTWSALANGPTQRFAALGDWDGQYFVAWGGRKATGGAPTTYADGKRFDGGAWLGVAAGGPGARYAPDGQAGFATRVSNSVTLLVGGLSANDTPLTDGAIYNSSTNSWTPVASWPSGEHHLYGVYVFAGGELVVWGGQHNLVATATGERFRP